MWKYHGKELYRIGLLPGLDDFNLLGEVYNDMTLGELIIISRPGIGCVAYSQEHDMFWVRGSSSTADLPNMTFGIVKSTGKVVEGIDADETTLEAGFKLCERAPYGAKKFLREFFA